MTDKMKPCPFCGGTAKELAEGYVSCFNHDCPMSAMSMMVDAWNTRAKDAKGEAGGKGDESMLTCDWCIHGVIHTGKLCGKDCRMFSKYERSKAKLATEKPVEPISIGKGTKMCNVCRRIEAVCICEKPAEVKEIEPLDLLAAFRSESVSGAIADKLNEIIDAINEMRKR